MIPQGTHAAFDRLVGPLPVPSSRELESLAVARGITPRVVLLMDGAECAGVALCRVEGRTYRLLGDDAHDYLALPCLPGRLPDLLDAVAADARSQGADLLSFEHLVGITPTPALAPHLRVGSTRYFDASEGWEEIFGSRDLKRKDNRIRRETAYRCEHRLGDLGDAELRALMDLHVERWRFQGPRSRFEREEPRRLMEAYPRENKLLTSIYDGDELVAAHFGMCFRETLLWHTPAINVKYVRHSPLMQLFLETARYAEANGFRAIDLGLGQEEYKARVSNADRAIFQYVRAVSARGMPAAAAFAARKRWGARAKPLVETLADAPRKLKLKASQVKNIVRVYELEGAPQVTKPGLDLGALNDWPALVDLCRANALTPTEKYHDRLRRGDTFLFLHDDAGQVLSYGWGCTEPEIDISEVGRKVDNRGRVMLFDFWTPTAHRGNGYYTELLRRIVAQPGRYQIFVLSKNTPSRKAIEKVGFQHIETLRGRVWLDG